MQQAWNEWSTVSRYFDQYINSEPAQALPTTYKFRAEAPDDVKLFLQQAKNAGVQISDVKMEPQTIVDNKGIKVPIPDVIVTFKSDSSLTTLQEILAKVPDGHVMYETLAWASSYTGNRVSDSPSEQKGTPLQQPTPRSEEMKDELPPGVEPDLSTSPQKEIQQQPPEVPKKPQQKKPKPSPPGMEFAPTVPPQFRNEPPKVASASEQLEVVAQAFLQKWLGKARHNLLPGKSSGLRLEIFELSAKARKNIDDVMNMLEKGLSEDLGSKISEVSRQMNTIRSLMRSLHNTEKPTKGQQPGAFEGFF
jgi:hypothetical protein